MVNAQFWWMKCMTVFFWIKTLPNHRGVRGIKHSRNDRKTIHSVLITVSRAALHQPVVDYFLVKIHAHEFPSIRGCLDRLLYSRWTNRWRRSEKAKKKKNTGRHDKLQTQTKYYRFEWQPARECAVPPSHCLLLPWKKERERQKKKKNTK